MKKLTWKLVLPLTIISIVTFTKWWYVEIDEYGEILTGFPLPFVCPGWHTSMSHQIFVFELAVDVICYFSIWFLAVLAVTKIYKSFRVPAFVTIILLGTSGLISIVLVLFAINPDNIYTITREFDIHVKQTGYRFLWEDEPPVNSIN
jgi:hypothetical protein